MVKLQTVQAHNAGLKSLSPGLVGVFGMFDMLQSSKAPLRGPLLRWVTWVVEEEVPTQLPVLGAYSNLFPSC